MEITNQYSNNKSAGINNNSSAAPGLGLQPCGATACLYPSGRNAPAVLACVGSPYSSHPGCIRLKCASVRISPCLCDRHFRDGLTSRQKARRLQSQTRMLSEWLLLMISFCIYLARYYHNSPSSRLIRIIILPSETVNIVFL